MSRRTITATQDELLCKNGCGFYGNPSWQGYCSKCWKDRGPGSNVAAAAASNIRKLASHAHQLHNATKKDTGKPKSESPKMGFDKFDRFEKRRGQKDDRKIKAAQSFFKGKPKQSPVAKGVVPTAPRPPGESQQVGDKFAEFLREEMEKKAALDVSKQVRAFIDKFVAKGEIGVAEQSEMVQDFYNDFQERINSNPIFKSVDEEKQKQLMDFMEKYLMTRLYRVVFSNPLSDDEDKDLKLQGKIRSLNWVTAAMLETGIDEKDVKVRAIIDDAISAIIEMDSKRAPADKLKTLVDCSKLIFEALHASSGRPASADVFLPSLIYLILQSNPPLLRSNISFISRFSLPERIGKGEAAYFFVNFCIAADYIADKLGASALNMTENEFQRYMTGELTPEASGYCLASGYTFEGLRLLHHDLLTLRELKEKAVKLKKEREQLRADIGDWVASVAEEVDAIIERTPMVILPPKIKFIDDENPPVEGLASPLVPSVIPDGLPIEWTRPPGEGTASTDGADLNWAFGGGGGGGGGGGSGFSPVLPRLDDITSPDKVGETAAATGESPRQDTPSSTGSPALGSLRSKHQSYDSLDLLEVNLGNLDSDDDLLQETNAD